MATACRSASSASSPAAAAVQISSRPLIDEVLEEDFRTKEDIASAQARISLEMSMEDIFGFPIEFPSLDVLDFQGDPTHVS